MPPMLTRSSRAQLGRYLGSARLGACLDAESHRRDPLRAREHVAYGLAAPARELGVALGRNGGGLEVAAEQRLVLRLERARLAASAVLERALHAAAREEAGVLQLREPFAGRDALDQDALGEREAVAVAGVADQREPERRALREEVRERRELAGRVGRRRRVARRERDRSE